MATPKGLKSQFLHLLVIYLRRSFHPLHLFVWELAPSRLTSSGIFLYGAVKWSLFWGNGPMSLVSLSPLT